MQPLIEPDGLYSRQQLIHGLKISGNTFDAWKAFGLKTIRPGTQSTYYLGSNIIEAMLRCTDAKGNDQ